MTDIYFRTDGNGIIATGHLVRCLTIARACVRQNARVTFIVSDEQSLTLLQEYFSFPQEFKILCLHGNYTNLSAELPALLALVVPKASKTSVSAADKPWIFVDSYYASPDYLSSLQCAFRVAYLDDLKAFDCPVDLVINYDTDRDCAHYTSARRRLLGVQYTPLRDQFQNTTYTVRPAVEHVLLSTGGTDPYAVAYRLLDTIYRTQPGDMSRTKSTTNPRPQPHTGCLSCPPDIPLLQSLHYHVLTSTANTRYDALVSYAQTHPSVHIHKNVSDVASLMASCDLAVCAGGTTLCELCAVGVPTVSYLMADNQRTAVETYAAAGLIPYAGDIRRQDADGSSVLSSVLSFMTCMSQNLPIRQKSSQSMRAFLNGSGASQIARTLLS